MPILADLISFESFGGNESGVQDYCAEFLRQIGAETDVWEIDLESLRQHRAFGMEVERESPIGVVGTLGQDEGGRSLILNGHVDVVPPGNLKRWQNPPWKATLAHKRVYGRGSCDMKGGLAAILIAAKAVVDAKVLLPGRVFIQPVVGEEDGGVGTLAAVDRGYRADGAIIAEPTKLKVVATSAGALSFRVRVSGLSAHGAVRDEGVSAIEKFGTVHQALRELERARNENVRDPSYHHYRLPFAISIGTIRAGVWASSVPDDLVFEGRYGVPPGEDLEHARAEFETAVAAAAAADSWLAEHPPSVEWWGGQFAPASIRADHPLVDVLTNAAADVGQTHTGVEGVPYGSDQRLLVNEGATPAVLFGPGDVRVAHRPDEFVPVDEVVSCSRALALTILRWTRIELMIQKPSARPGN